MKPQHLVLLIAAVLIVGCAATPPTRSRDSEAIAQKLGAPVLARERRCDAEVTQRFFPQYPVNARRANIQGWVLLSFDLDGSGRAVNILIVKNQPDDTFNKSAVEALEKSTFVERAKRAGCETVVMFSLNPD